VPVIWLTPECRSGRYEDIQNAMNALEKNDGTLVEPDARLAQRQVTGFMNSFFFLELEPRARVELAACRLRIGVLPL